jgi:hypothetical protein
MVVVDPRETHYNAYDQIYLLSETATGWESVNLGEYFIANERPIMRIDGSGTFHFAYNDRAYPDYSGHRLIHGTWDGVSYASEIVFVPEDVSGRSWGTAEDIRLAVHDDAVHLLWVEGISYTGQVMLHYMTNAGGDWLDEELEAPFPVLQIGETALELDSGGVPHVLYKMGNNYYYANRVGGTWSRESAPSGGTFMLQPEPTIARGQYNEIVIQRRTGPDQWSEETIPVRGSIGLSSALVDDGGRWHFVYSAANLLRHAWLE